ncbi:MAG: hypothetical protein ABR586_06415 [Thermoplasmatota archaeon]
MEGRDSDDRLPWWKIPLGPLMWRGVLGLLVGTVALAGIAESKSFLGPFAGPVALLGGALLVRFLARFMGPRLRSQLQSWIAMGMCVVSLIMLFGRPLGAPVDFKASSILDAVLALMLLQLRSVDTDS